MNRQEAIEKVAKLRRLASDNQNPNEADTARRQADKLATEYHITEQDLSAGKIAAAYDELVDAVQQYTAQRMPLIGATTSIFPGVESIVTGILSQLKNAGEVDKAQRLRKIATVIRTASLFSQHDVVVGLNSILDTIINRHEIKL
jgi:uncharacterized coiled-coil DUF342 family protein